ncbi:MAG TPA: VIT and VWA domain-containing protein [Thermomicrobiales bacterium]|jgi:Ca-activated chloride channel family protein
MFNRAAYWNSRPDGVAVLEVAAGDEPRRFVPLRRTAVSGEIAGPLAALRVTHTYGYSRAECAQVLEAVYRFPLPGDAAVTGLVVRFGAVEITAELQDRERAEATYAEAQGRGEQAALATREAPDVFTLRVTGLKPDEPITVETSYVQLARPTATGWSLRLPLTTAPRYVREDERGARAAAGQPLAVLRDPGHRFTLDLALREVGAVTSPTHPLTVDDDGALTHVRLRDGEVLPDRDCVIAWEARQEATRPALTILTHDDPGGGYRYFLALIAPPRPETTAEMPPETVPREVILLVDHSGSMSGPKWAAADWATRSFLGGLTARDNFALGLFHDTTRWFAPETRSGSPEATAQEATAQATAFLLAQQDSGGTNLGVALEQALRLRRAEGARARHILIVTDAEVSDAARILRLAEGEAAQAERRRISVLCIDAAPNAFLATELAERGGGVSRFLTSAPEEEDISTALDAVLGDWAAPLHSGLRLAVNHPGLELARDHARAGDVGWSEIALGDLPAGRAIWTVGRVPLAAEPLSFRLAGAARAAAPLAQVEVGALTTDLPALKALFGAKGILGLEFLLGAGYDDVQLREQLRHLGYDPAQVLAGEATAPPNVYAENARGDTTKALRSFLVSEALGYGLASAETAFVAVRREAGQPVAGTVVVANALPPGWSPGFLSGGHMRQTGGRMMRMMSSGGVAMPLNMAAPASPARATARFAKSAMSSPMVGAAPSTMSLVTIFAGRPQLVEGEAVLFDSASTASAQALSPRTISRLVISFTAGTPAAVTLDPTLTIAIFVDDLAAPRADVRLAELIRQGGERPLNLAWRAGQTLRIILRDPSGAWADGAPEFELSLG